MPTMPGLFERVLFRLNLAPSMMLDYVGAQAFAAVNAARRLGVLRALEGGALTAGEVAARTGIDPRGASVLLRALAAVGYLREAGGRYRLAPVTAKWAPVLGDGIDFFDRLVERSRGFEETLRRGGPAIDARAWLDARPGGWSEFQAGMVAIARLSLDEVISKLRIPRSARRLLDVGGGHGLYAIAACRAHPGLSATVFDLPAALDSARERIAAEEMASRVSPQAGDFWIDDLGHGYDVALLFNIIHGISAERNVELLRRVAAALVPGGRLAILDQLTGRVRGPTSRAIAAVHGLTLFDFAGGETYSFDTIASWLRTTGFDDPRRRRLVRSPGSSLVLATRAREP